MIPSGLIRKQQDSHGIPVSKHLIYHLKFLLANSHNSLSHIRIKVRIIKPNKNRRIINKIINKIKATYVSCDIDQSKV